MIKPKARPPFMLLLLLTVNNPAKDRRYTEF
jgi:hypothetical protein